jgi:drug/metabolite transporter (DMT)-like permease
MAADSPKPIPRWLGVLLLLAIAVMFGSNHISARLAFDHGANVVTAVAARSTVTAVFVLALLLVNGVPLALPRTTLRRGLGIGLVLAVQSYCLYSAVALIPVALALLAFNTFPMLLSLISWAAGAERPSRRTLVAMPIALAGLALALDVAGIAGGKAVNFAERWEQIGRGVAFALAAAASFATVVFLTTRWLADVDGRIRSLLTMSSVAAIALVGGTLTQSFAFPVDGAGWIGLALLTLFYGVAITSLFIVLPRLGAVNNAALLNFEPIAILFLAWPILGQTVAPLQILGALIVVGAISVLASGKRK